MKYTPVWKDIDLTLSVNAVDFTIKKDGEWLHSGRAVAYPSENVAKLNINHFLEEDLNPEFGSDIREADDDVVANPDAYGEFEVRDENDGLLEKYGVLYDWSYEDNWTGQTKYIMTNPINGHLDPRMRMMCSYFNTGETEVNYGIGGGFFVVSPNSLSFTNADRLSGATKSVSVSSNDAWSATISGYTGFSIINVTSDGFDVRLASGSTVNSNQTAIVTVTNPEHTATVNVSLKPSLIVTPAVCNDPSYRGGGSGYNINIWSDGDWHLDTERDTNLILTPSAGTSGDTSVNVVVSVINTGASVAWSTCYLVDSNGLSRSGYPTVATYPYYTASTSPSGTTFLSSGGTGQKITVNTNSTVSSVDITGGGWIYATIWGDKKVSGDTSWLKVYNVQSGSFYVSASTNNKAVMRYGDVVVSIANSTYTAKLTVYQYPKTDDDSNYFYYHTNSGNLATPNNTDSYYWGANYITNDKYHNGRFFLLFDNTITGVAPGAFSGNTDLYEIEIPSEVTVVYGGAFSGCTTLQTICCYATTAPNLGSNVFSGIHTDGVLLVPANANTAYETRWLPALPSGWTISRTLQ